MIIQTSNFARCGRNPKAVAISIGVPKGWIGKRYLKLAPPKNMLYASKEDFDSFYFSKLEAMDAQQVYNELIDRFGDEVILLCWEAPNIRCHRRIVAEWFETKLGIIVPEFGFERSAIKPYAQMLRKGEKPVDIENRAPMQLGLFGV